MFKGLTPGNKKGLLEVNAVKRGRVERKGERQRGRKNKRERAIMQEWEGQREKNQRRRRE